MDTPHPSTGTGSSTVGCTMSRGKGRRRVYGRVIMITHTETGKKDGKVHLYGQTMIARMSPQLGKSHKRRSTRNRYRQEKRNCRSYHKNKGCVDRNRRRNQGKNYHKPVGMVRMKRTHSKRSPQGKEPLTSPRRITRMEQAARDAKGTFHTLVEPKGKATITRWEKEINAKRKGKAWEELIQEADWITDPGATQPRETLYHKMVEMAWRTKMLIGKVSSERKDASRKDNKDHKKLLKEILSRLSNLEASTKWLAEDQRDQKEKMERVAAQFHLYLCYVHHMDITPADGNGAPTLYQKDSYGGPEGREQGQGG
jgi:hypothetical protein